MVSAKGKEKVTDGFAKGKRKGGGDDDKTGRKRKNRGVVQFFEDEAYDVDEDEDSSDESMFDLEDFVDEFSENYKVNKEPARDPNLHFVKEEDMSEEELDRMLEERYKPGAGFVTYMEDGHDHKKSIDRNIYVPSSQDSIIWKVKCMIGRERFSAFCLMQKFADMVYLGNKLQIISACAVEHVKGFIFIEAEKQQDIYEACKGLSSIYSSRVAAVPTRELSRLLSVRSKSSGISEGMWARVKNGMYKGDLAQVVAVNHDRKKTTVKLVPRIDLKAMAEKIAAGVTGRTRRTVIPAQRLISSSELEEFRPLIQSRRDRETNQMFEILDGMMLKDGYLYKKISIDSLSFWGVMPTEDELLKFESSKKEESTDVQWLSQLFGEKEKKKKEVEIVKDKGGGKSEGVSSACIGSNFEMHELVFFGRKDFGVVIGSEKGDSVKVLKEGSEGSSVVTVKQTDLRSASFDKKLFSVLDQHSNTLSVNDTVRVLEGPLKDRQGIVKKIYGGVLFLCDECEQENNGYICVKAKLCEKVCGSVDASKEKGSEPGPSNFADIPSSPKSPLSTDKSWQERDSNNNNFKRDDNDIFSVGQSLRIRVGPLKGYRCRVLAVRRSDVTVKLDSQQKILTVKSEHLSEVREKNSAVALGDGSGSIKPFDFLGTQDGARDWGGTAPSTDGDNWNVGGSTERSSWSALPSSSILMAKDSVSGDDNATKGAEDSSWQVKASPDQNSSWGAPASCSKEVTETGSLDGWGKPVQSAQDDSWGAAAKKQSTEVVAWGHSGASSDPETSAWKKDSDALDKSKQNTWENKDKMDKDASSGGWGMGGGSAWGSKDISGGSRPVIGSSPTVESESGAWGNAGGGGSSQVAVETGGWGKSAEKANEDASGKSSWGNSASKSSWGQQADVNNNNNNNTASSDGWGKTNVSNKEDKTIKDSETGNGWNSSSQNKDNNSGGWNVSRDSNNNTSGWGGSSKANEESGAASGWGKEKKTNENSQSAWNASTPSLDENKGGNWGSQKTSEETSGGWNSSGNGKNESGSSWKNNGGSAAGWGQSNWLKNEGNAVGGNQDSTWSSKSNWNSDNQDNNGSGGWRGGRGGRGDRGGFRGRGGSDRGGFGGRGVGRGGFGGRDGSDRGGFGGRGGSDREGGYRGRGGFRGRGGRGGDWNNRGDDSNVDSKSYSWGKSSQNDGEGWKSGGNGGGNWGQKDSGANNLSQNWGQPKGDSSQSGGWKNGGGDSTWGQAKGDSSDMRQSKESRQDEGAGNNAWGKAASSSWGAASTGDGNSSGDWKKSEGGMDGGGQRKDEGPSDGWGKAATTSTWGSGGGSGGW